LKELEGLGMDGPEFDNSKSLDCGKFRKLVCLMRFESEDYIVNKLEDVEF
jgi:hypothetical protein